LPLYSIKEGDTPHFRGAEGDPFTRIMRGIKEDYKKFYWCFKHKKKLLLYNAIYLPTSPYDDKY
jgi:hypothetical protein